MTREILERSLLRVLGPRGAAAGLAVLVGPGLAMTTRQVVDRAIRDTHGALTVERALGAGSARCDATPIEVGRPAPRPTSEDQAVVLRLDDGLEGINPAPLLVAEAGWGRQVHVFGYPPGVPDGAWSAGVLREETAFGWIQVDPAPGAYPHSAGFAGTAVWDEEADGVVGVLAARSGELVPVRHLAAAAPELHGLHGTSSPFLGLSAFTESDGARFFGRDREIEEIVARLRQERWVTVAGDSGVGKSSLALAGVVPRMRAAGYDVVVARSMDGSLDHVWDRVREYRQTRQPLIVVLDQAEELLAGPAATGAPSGHAMDFFGDTLPPNTRVLTTARLDLVGRLADDERWRRLARTPHLYPIGPLGPDELRSMATLPLEGTGVRYEDGLVNAILADAGSAVAPMPLLGHLLQQLWLARAGGTITHAAYHTLGGVTGSIAQHAETVWAGLEEAGAAQETRSLLTRLVDLRAADAVPVRRPVEAAHLTTGLWRVAQQLTAQRLLVTSGNAAAVVVELVHEEILRAWDRLADWIDQDRAVLVWRHGVRRDAARWEAAGRDAALLPGTPTSEPTSELSGERSDGLEETEQEFLTAARHSWRARGRARVRWRIGFGLAATVAAVLTTLAGINSIQAREHQRLADSRALAHVSQDLQRTDPVLAIMTSLAAYERAPTREARDQLMRRYLQHAYQQRVASSDASEATDLVHSRDGDVSMTVHESGRVVLTLDLFSGPARTLAVPGTHVDNIVLAQDGTRAVFFYSGGHIGWLDINRRAADPIGPVHLLPAPDIPRPDRQPGNDSMEDLDSLDAKPAMTTDGRYLVAGMAGQLVWWDLEQGQNGTFLSARPLPKDSAWDLHIGADKDLVMVTVSTSPDVQDRREKIVTLDRTDGAVRDVTPFADDVSVSGDGEVALICQEHGGRPILRRYNTVTGTPLPGTYQGRAETSCAVLVSAVDFEGRQAYLEDGGLWDFEASRMASRPRTLPSLDSTWMIGTPSLVERGGDLSFMRTEDNALVTYDLPTSGIREISDVVYSIVSDDGATQAAVTDGGKRLMLVPLDAEGEAQPRATAERLKPLWEFEQGDRIMYDADERYLLGREGRNVVTVRDARTLDVVSTITTVEPKVVEPTPDLSGDGNGPGPMHKGPTSVFWYSFDGGGNVITRADTLVQLWDTSTGQETARFDIATLQPEDEPDPLTIVNLHSEPGIVLVTTYGQTGTDVVDLRTGKVTETLATPDTAVSAQMDPNGASMAVLRTGAVMDLYTLDPLRKISESHPLNSNSQDPAVYGFDDQGRFVIAARDTIKILEVGASAPVESYQFGDPLSGSDAVGGFMHVSSNAEHVVRIPARDDIYSGALNLDPQAWREHLCEVIGGRAFTDEEIDVLPALANAQICPPSPA